MRVFVAGATGALGVPVVKLLVDAGHDVTGLTRSEAKRPMLERLGAKAVVGDALDAGAVDRAVSEAKPDAIVSLLTRLPKNGPTRLRHMRPNARVHREGTRNIVRAAQASGVERIVAESVVFRYGYGELKPMLTEEDPAPEALPGPANEALSGVIALEDAVLGAGGIVLRYGLFYGPGAGHMDFLAKMLRRRMMRLPGGDLGALSFIHMEDGATGTVAALERGGPGIYNVCDDEPVSFAAFIREVARVIGAKPPKPVPLALARLVMPYGVMAMTGRVTMSNAKAKRELGWMPRYPSIREGLSGMSRSHA
ncbi:MAG: NAD(P)-dependent oxidoreductase [Actinomycetota bacterium]